MLEKVSLFDLCLQASTLSSKTINRCLFLSYFVTFSPNIISRTISKKCTQYSSWKKHCYWKVYIRLRSTMQKKKKGNAWQLGLCYNSATLRLFCSTTVVTQQQGNRERRGVICQWPHIWGFSAFFIFYFFFLYTRQRSVVRGPEAALKKSSHPQQMPVLRTRPLTTWRTALRGHVRAASKPGGSTKTRNFITAVTQHFVTYLPKAMTEILLFIWSKVLRCVCKQSHICYKVSSHLDGIPCNPKSLDSIEN